MKKEYLKTFWCAGLLVALVACLAVSVGCNDSGKGSRLKKTTDFGAVKGYNIEESEVLAWQGIPFGAPPVGDLRWKAPEDPESWTKTLQASESGSPCTQFEMDRTWHATGEIVGCEDCLYLDVYRPDTDEKDLPVYFWIHGGSNKFGSAASYADNAIAMAEKLDVVVVVTQYRLGPFGWFRHAELRDEDPENYSNSGNFGTLDQIKALEWVQENIDEFGGNPDNVTIAGQSAGGHNVKNLLVSPLAAGLFHKAVSESGIMPVVEASDKIAATISAALEISGENMVEQLRSADAEAILVASSGVQTFIAFADGYVIPDTVVNAVYQGNYNQVPIILGGNENEFYNFLPLYGAALGKPMWDNVHDLFDPDFDPDHEWTYDEIFPPGSDEEAIYQTAGTYASMGYRAKYLDELAGYLSDQQDDVYGYIFKWAGGGVDEMEEFRKVFGAAHSMEISFFFGGEHSLFGYSFIEENETGRKALQDVMQTYLYNFMTTGDPGIADDGTPWDPWSNEEGMYKAITFDADATEARIGYINDGLEFEELDEYLSDQLTTMSPENAATWGSMLPFSFGQGPESIRFSHRIELEAIEGATAYSGTYGYDVEGISEYHLAGYQLEIPEGWEPSDGLVLYCHGYRGDVPQLSVSAPSTLRSHLIDQGYAWAASSYGENGYNIGTGVVGTRQLLRLITAEFGAPDPVYIVGHSMGGHITARSVTQYPDAYDGAMPMCGVVGGGIEQFSYSLDWALLANYFSGLNYALPFTQEQAGTLLGYTFGAPDESGNFPGTGVFGYIPPGLPDTSDPERLAVLNTTGEMFKDATMYRSGGDRPLYDAAFANTAFFQVAAQGIGFASDPTSGGGRGNAVENTGREYYLDSSFSAQTEDEVALNNGIQRIGLDDDDVEFDFDDIMYPVYGNITIPVLTLHDIGDYFVPFEHERIYAQNVAEAGKSDLLRSRVIRSIDHCGFTPQETAASFDSLAAWVESGIIPDGDNVLDPTVVAEDDYGCQFTLYQRPVDGTAGDWICESAQ